MAHDVYLFARKIKVLVFVIGFVIIVQQFIGFWAVLAQGLMDTFKSVIVWDKERFVAVFSPSGFTNRFPGTNQFQKPLRINSGIFQSANKINVLPPFLVDAFRIRYPVSRITHFRQANKLDHVVYNRRTAGIVGTATGIEIIYRVFHLCEDRQKTILGRPNKNRFCPFWIRHHGFGFFQRIVVKVLETISFWVVRESINTPDFLPIHVGLHSPKGLFPFRRANLGKSEKNEFVLANHHRGSIPIATLVYEIALFHDFSALYWFGQIGDLEIERLVVVILYVKLLDAAFFFGSEPLIYFRVRARFMGLFSSRCGDYGFVAIRSPTILAVLLPCAYALQ
mmetsp:Transcript_2208/g.5282  ORF Transcript_2208/g.5282 Transcript_2208/m.5282 type:complete len:337 (+) Transcript_2208:194-1204(+)